MNEVNRRSDGSIDQTILDFGKAWLGTAIGGTAFTFAESMMQIDTEGSAAAGTVATIANGGTGKLLLLRSTDADRVITLAHDAGNIWSPTLDDVVLDDPNRVVLLLYQGEYWTMKTSAPAGTPPSGELEANFAYAADGLTVQFTDLSTGTPVSWDWEFGDSGTSASQDPSHVYSAGGYYDVTLTVEDADSNVDSITRRVFVNADYWQREWDFIAAQSDWAIGNDYLPNSLPFGALTGAGFEDTLEEINGNPDSDNWRGVSIQCDIPITTNIRRWWFFGTITPGSFTTPSQITWAKRRILEDDSVQQEVNTAATSVPTVGTLNLLTTFAPNPDFDVNQLAAWLACGVDLSHPLSDPGGTLTLRGIVLVGDGENPWGENNVSERLVVTQQPTTTAEDATISPSITLQVWNQFDVLLNPGGAQVTVTLGDDPGGATLGGTTTRTFSLGTVTFNDLTISEAGTGYTLVFEVTSIDTAFPGTYVQFKPLSVESDPFDVT